MSEENNVVSVPTPCVIDDEVVVYNFGVALWRGTKYSVVDDEKSDKVLIEFYDGDNWVELASMSLNGTDFKTLTLITSVAVMNQFSIAEAAEYVEAYLNGNINNSDQLH